MKIAKIIFKKNGAREYPNTKNAKIYHFWDFFEDLQPNERVVVQDSTGIHVGKFVGYFENIKRKISKKDIPECFVISKIDFEKFNNFKKNINFGKLLFENEILKKDLVNREYNNLIKYHLIKYDR